MCIFFVAKSDAEDVQQNGENKNDPDRSTDTTNTDQSTEQRNQTQAKPSGPPPQSQTIPNQSPNMQGMIRTLLQFYSQLKYIFVVVYSVAPPAQGMPGMPAPGGPAQMQQFNTPPPFAYGMPPPNFMYPPNAWQMPWQQPAAPQMMGADGKPMMPKPGIIDPQVNFENKLHHRRYRMKTILYVCLAISQSG